MLKRQNTFTIEYFSEVEKKQYDGKFTSRIATFSDKQKINVRTSQLCGGYFTVRDDNGEPTGRGIDEITEYNARMVAWLEIVLVQKPDWFKLDDPENGIVDEDLILKIFKEVMSYEGTFRGVKRPAVEGEKGPVQSGEGTSAKEPAKTIPGNIITPVVGREVQAALDP